MAAFNWQRLIMNFIKNIFSKQTIQPTNLDKLEQKHTKVKKKSNKELATEAGEPYINIISVELDPDNIGNGSFELDWNDIFVAKLVKAGYMQKKDDTDDQIVDRWFQSICRNILNENYEQWEANQPVDSRPRRVDRNDLGNGRTEIS
jgi:hypothetical protein